MPSEVLIPKVWRSEVSRLILFFILSAISVVLSRQYPDTVITGKLFTLAGKTFWLSLPLFWLAPFFALMELAVRIYNVRFKVDGRGIEAQSGILSFSTSITRVRYEDIRSIETDQSLIGRFLDVGDVLIGTAATSGIEIAFHGVEAPREIQEMIQRERDRRLSSSRPPPVKKREEPAPKERARAGA